MSKYNLSTLNQRPKYLEDSYNTDGTFEIDEKSVLIQRKNVYLFTFKSYYFVQKPHLEPVEEKKMQVSNGTKSRNKKINGQPYVVNQYSLPNRLTSYKRVPVYSQCEAEFGDKYSKETLALMSFIKSRRQISIGTSTAFRVPDRSSRLRNMRKSQSVRRLDKFVNHSRIVTGNKAVQYKNVKPTNIVIHRSSQVPYYTQ